MDRHVVIIGLMGAGKTSIGRRVARALSRPLLDGDERLEAAEGRTAAQIVDAEGLAFLHRLEAAVFHDALAHPHPAVVAPAASVVDDDACLAALHGHHVVWLHASAEHLAAKADEKDHRPLVGGDDDEALFARQIAEREPRIVDVADLVIDAEATSKDDAAARIVELVSSPGGAASSPAPSSPAPSS